MRFLILALLFASCVSGAEPVEALDLVNAQRAARGLPAYQRDDGLTRGAAAVATYRAEHLYDKHVSAYERGGSDFAFLPAGAHADAAGCAAWESGFGACAMFETQYHTAGAAFVVGRDGKRYCHLFVRRGPPTATVALTPPHGDPSVSPARVATSDADTISALNFRLSAAEQWGKAGGFKATRATSPVTLDNLDKRLAAMEAFGQVAGYRAPKRVATLEGVTSRLAAAEAFGQTMGYVPPVPTKATPASGKTVHCIQYTDATKTTIAREWDEPAPAWLSDPSCTGCTDCQCPTGDCAAGKCPATRTPVRIQAAPCPNGQCPNQKGAVMRGGHFPG